VQIVQQQAAALRHLFEIIVENRPGSSDEANYRKAIDESLFYYIYFTIFILFYYICLKPSG